MNSKQQYVSLEESWATVSTTINQILIHLNKGVSKLDWINSYT